MDNMTKIIACIPCYRCVEALPYMSHLLLAAETGRAQASGKYIVRWNVGGPGVRVPMVRNTAVEIALSCGADYLFFCDDDMIVPQDIIERLLAMNAPIACPIFFRGGDRPGPLVFNINEYGNPIMMENYPIDQIFEAPGGCGTGVMLIRRDVLESIEKPHFYYPQYSGLGMDLDFCRRAVGKGYSVFCDSRILVEQMDEPKPIGQVQWEKHRGEK